MDPALAERGEGPKLRMNHRAGRGACQRPRQVAAGQGHLEPPACSQIMSGLEQPQRTPQGAAWAKSEQQELPTPGNAQVLRGLSPLSFC